MAYRSVGRVRRTASVVLATPTPSVQTASTQAWGPGGGGGGSGGNAGGGGEYAAELTNTVIPGQTYTITVPAGGLGGTSGGGAGGTSTSTTFSGPGATTVNAHAGTGGPATGSGGAGGTGSTNSTHHNGGAGGTAPSTGGGGGGGSGGTAAAGNAGSPGSGATGGAGAVAVTGGGPGGNGGNTGVAGSHPATPPGGGGGGGGSGTAGGAGDPGQVTITWTYNGGGTITFTNSGTWTAPVISGDGQVLFDVPSANHRWILETVVVNVSGAAPGLFPQVVLYVGGVQSSGLSEGATWTGNQQTFTGRIDMDSGITLMVAFIAGPFGAKATAIIEGEAELWQ